MSEFEFQKQSKAAKRQPNHKVVMREAAIVFFVLFTAALLAYAVGTLVSGR